MGFGGKLKVNATGNKKIESDVVDFSVNGKKYVAI